MKTHLFIAVTLFLLSFFVMTPQFFVIRFNLIDDGQDILVVQQDTFNETIMGTLHEGRFWPLRLIFRKAIYLTFGMFVPGHFIAMTLLLGFLLCIVAATLSAIRLTPWLSFFFCVIMLSLPGTYANFYRLGTVEPLQTALLMISLLALVRRSLVVSIGIWGISLLAKETSVFYGFPLVVYFVSIRKYRHAVLTGSMSMLFIWLMVSVVLPKGGYSQNASFSLGGISHNLLFSIWNYWPIYIGIIGNLCIGVMLLLTNRMSIHSKEVYIFILILAFVVAGIFPFSIWSLWDMHYVLPVQTFLVILSAYSIFLVSKTYFLQYFFVIPALYFISAIVFIPKSLEVARYWHQEYIYNGALVDYLLRELSGDIHVYSNIVDYEKNHKIFIYASNFLTRQTTFTPDMSTWLHLSLGDSFGQNNMALGAMRKFEQDRGKRLLISGYRIPAYAHIYTFLPLCARSPFVRSDCRFFIYRDQSI